MYHVVSTASSFPVSLATLNTIVPVSQRYVYPHDTSFAVGSRQRLLAASNDEICVSLGNQRTERLEHTKSLGLTIDDRLSWSNYIIKRSM